MMDETTVLAVLQGGLALYCVLTGLQALSDFDRYTDGGVLGVDIAKLQFRKGYQRELFETAFANQRFRYVLYIHVLAGFFLGVQGINGSVSPVGLAVVLGTTVLVGIRHHAGLNGTYHVSLVVVLGLLWASTTTAEVAVQLAIAAIAVQVVLAYTVSGWLKLPTEEWRNGQTLRDLADAEIWVSERAASIINRHPAIAKPLCWGVLAFECLFVLVLVAPEEIAVALLGAAAVFHAVNALAMGFNTFLVIFPATYPAIYYTNRLVYATFGF